MLAIATSLPCQHKITLFVIFVFFIDYEDLHSKSHMSCSFPPNVIHPIIFTCITIKKSFLRFNSDAPLSLLNGIEDKKLVDS